MITLWHNPRCSKSRQALALLQDAGAQVEIRKYLEEPPGLAELHAVRVALGSPPVIDMIRSGEKLFKELGLARDTPEDILLGAMVSHPILIERPIALSVGKAVIGRPPELVKTLL